MGANDGPSFLAVLLGVADALRARPPGWAWILCFVDGEDWGDFNDSTETLLGARRPARVDSVWRCAARLGYMAEFPDGVSQPIIDDHLPLQRAGLEVIDVIDLQYGPDNRWHHATDDTRDKISGESLARTAHLATALVRGCFERP